MKAIPNISSLTLNVSVQRGNQQPLTKLLFLTKWGKEENMPKINPHNNLAVYFLPLIQISNYV